MIIIKSFSNTDDQEVLYSVLLDEEEMRLYTSFFGNLRNAINRVYGKKDSFTTEDVQKEISGPWVIVAVEKSTMSFLMMVNIY